MQAGSQGCKRGTELVFVLWGSDPPGLLVEFFFLLLLLSSCTLQLDPSANMGYDTSRLAHRADQ